MKTALIYSAKYFESARQIKIFSNLSGAEGPTCHIIILFFIKWQIRSTLAVLLFDLIFHSEINLCRMLAIKASTAWIPRFSCWLWFWPSRLKKRSLPIENKNVHQVLEHNIKCDKHCSWRRVVETPYINTYFPNGWKDFSF